MNNAAPHRRTNSTSQQPIQALRAGHRRAISTINAFSPLLRKRSKSPQDFPQDSLNSPIKELSPPKTTEFLTLLNNSFSYFQQPSIPQHIYVNETHDMLLTQVESLQERRSQLEASNALLKSECELYEKSLNEHLCSKKEFEMSLNALKQYNQQLEKALNKVTNELRFQKLQNEELSEIFGVKERELANRTVHVENVKENSIKKINKSRQEEEIPIPKPITYKPLSQRSARGSRDSSQSHRP